MNWFCAFAFLNINFMNLDLSLENSTIHSSQWHIWIIIIIIIYVYILGLVWESNNIMMIRLLWKLIHNIQIVILWINLRTAQSCNTFQQLGHYICYTKYILKIFCSILMNLPLIFNEHFNFKICEKFRNHILA